MAEPDLLRGRIVLVTGASRGIGHAVARDLAAHGASVHVLSRDPSEVESVARDSGGAAWPTDLTDDAEVWTTVDALMESLGGPPDALVNSAGAFEMAPLAETSVQMFDRQIGVNLRGAFLMIRALLPAFLERGSGHIVNVGSVAGRLAFPSNGAYSASKFGLRGLHEVLLAELQGTGVAATLVEPSATDTALWEGIDRVTNPGLPEAESMLRPEDVAGAVRFVLTRAEHVRVPLLQIQRR